MTNRHYKKYVPVIFSLLLSQALYATEERFDCVIDPSRVIKVSSPNIGLLAKVLVHRGDHVTKGQVIARLESKVESHNTALRRAQAKTTAAIDSQQERLALSRKSYQRISRLPKDTVISRQQIDELASEVKINEKELAKVKFDQKLAKLELKRAEAMLEQRTIRSPIDGVIIEQLLSGGEFVDNDSHIVLLAKMDPLYVETFLPVALYNKVQNGMSAVVEPEEPIGGQHQAKISIIDQVFDSASGTFGIRLELPNPDKKLPAGLRCKVIFNFE